MKVSENKEYFGVAFYAAYEEDVKSSDLKWYFCNSCYAKKPDNMNEEMTGMILYSKINPSSSRNYVITAHKICFHTFFLTWVGDQRLWLVTMPTPLMEVWGPLYHVVKYKIMSPLELV